MNFENFSPVVLFCVFAYFQIVGHTVTCELLRLMMDSSIVFADFGVHYVVGVTIYCDLVGVGFDVDIMGSFGVYGLNSSVLFPSVYNLF